MARYDSHKNLKALSRVAVIAILAFGAAFVMAPISSVHAGVVIATMATGCASCTSTTLTFSNVPVGDIFVLAAMEGPSTHYPSFGTTNHGEIPVSQHIFAISGNDGSYQSRASTFTTTASGTYSITASYTDTTASFFVAYELRGFSATMTNAINNGPNGNEWTGTISTIPANAFVMAIAFTTDSAAQSWSIAPGNDPGGVLVADTNHWKSASEYVCCSPPTSFHFDLQATTGTFTGGFMIDFVPVAGGCCANTNIVVIVISTTTVTSTYGLTPPAGSGDPLRIALINQFVAVMTFLFFPLALLFIGLGFVKWVGKDEVPGIAYVAMFLIAVFGFGAIGIIDSWISVVASTFVILGEHAIVIIQQGAASVAQQAGKARLSRRKKE